MERSSHTSSSSRRQSAPRSSGWGALAALTLSCAACGAPAGQPLGGAGGTISAGLDARGGSTNGESESEGLPGIGGTESSSVGLAAERDAGSSGLPCELSKLLVDRCQSCHASPPTGGAPMALVTYGDLVAPSPNDPSESVLRASILRMQSPLLPMPPKPATPATAAETAILQDWETGGSAPGGCAAAEAGTK